MLEIVHQADHLIDVVLQRRTCHEEDTVCMAAEVQYVLTSLGFCILDIVGFVDDDHVDIEFFFDLEVILETLEVGDCDTALF